MTSTNGYIDRSGEYVIEPAFALGLAFSEIPALGGMAIAYHVWRVACGAGGGVPIGTTGPFWGSGRRCNGCAREKETANAR